MAGSEITPVVFRLLAGQGMNADEEFPKPLTREVVTAADVVVTLGRGDAYLVRPGRRYLDWDLPELGGLDIESARAVRDGLATRVDVLVDELLRGGAGGVRGGRVGEDGV
ncbi:arsenate reductase ArsC [Streptomyces sp. NPDC048341]|uniref:arsenate reductase ArsC n=1 Tax=unclassified Streptomyces TaxID=2593676 RepID=UPI00342E7E8F